MTAVKRINYFDVLKALSIIFVIYLHYPWTSASWGTNITMMICYIAVPLFLMINGTLILNKKINRGFIIDDYVVISEYDIENVKRDIKYKSSYKLGKKIKNFNDLNFGDYVVHASHGIGIYGGVITLEKNGLKKDYLLINYAGNDKIYVPVEKIDLIFKYADNK